MPSPVAARIAVIGRQCGRWYFSSKPTIWESAVAIASSANSRAFSDTDKRFAADAARAAANQGTPVCTVQKIAAAVWSAVRVALLRAPTLLTSSKSRANAALVKSGAPLNASPLLPRNMKGVTPPQCARIAGAESGGVS